MKKKHNRGLVLKLRAQWIHKTHTYIQASNHTHKNTDTHNMMDDLFINYLLRYTCAVIGDSHGGSLCVCVSYSDNTAHKTNLTWGLTFTVYTGATDNRWPLECVCARIMKPAAMWTQWPWWQPTHKWFSISSMLTYQEKYPFWNWDIWYCCYFQLFVMICGSWWLVWSFVILSLSMFQFVLIYPRFPVFCFSPTQVVTPPLIHVFCFVNLPATPLLPVIVLSDGQMKLQEALKPYSQLVCKMVNFSRLHLWPVCDTISWPSWGRDTDAVKLERGWRRVQRTTRGASN